MTVKIEELSKEELIQLKHYWCIQTDRRDSKCVLDGKVIWEGNSCKGCPYEIKNKTMAMGDIVNVKKYNGGHWKGKITNITDRYNDKIVYSQPIATVNGLDTKGHAVMMESNLAYKYGEWWEVRL